MVGACLAQVDDRAAASLANQGGLEGVGRSSKIETHHAMEAHRVRLYEFSSRSDIRVTFSR